jgi:molybdate transport system regulatory protein
MPRGKRGLSQAGKTSSNTSTACFRGRVWIDGPEGTFIGHGRAVLLERIMEFGSITKAAKSMDMAYRHAWDLVDSMNRQAKDPFVEVATGGKGGGGARVTKAGEQAIKTFWRFHKDLQVFLKREEQKLGKTGGANRKKAGQRDKRT